MALAVVDIWNASLALIGNSTLIALPGEDTEEARVLRTLYPTTLDSILRTHEWSFANAYATLTDTGASVTGWTYAYRLPADCLAARRILTSTPRAPAVPVPFELGHIVYDPCIFTDRESAVLQFTSTVPDDRVHLLDPLFEKALAFMLAGEIGVPLRGAANVSLEQLTVLGRQALTTAMAVNANIRQVSPDIEASMLRARD